MSIRTVIDTFEKVSESHGSETKISLRDVIHLLKVHQNLETLVNGWSARLIADLHQDSIKLIEKISDAEEN